MKEATFAVDCMLGSLAKWLRILGFDVVYANKASDRELIEVHLREGRILLSRDRALVERAERGRALLITSDHLKDQLVQVFESLQIRIQSERVLRRCSSCNGLLSPLPLAEAIGKVPDFIIMSGMKVVTCRGCGKTFWRGSHTEHMHAMIKQLHLDRFFVRDETSHQREHDEDYRGSGTGNETPCASSASSTTDPG